MPRAKHQPPRVAKPLFMQIVHVHAFEDLAHSQKKQGGLTAPELAELAVLLVCSHFGEDTTELQHTKRGG